MNWTEFQTAYDDAKRTMRLADSQTAGMAAMIAGRLRRADVSGSTLEKLKKELRDYNIHTRLWKQK